MASKRQLKKEINRAIYDVVDECFSVQLFNVTKKEKSDQIIDSAASVQEELLARLNTARSKEEFRSIRSDFMEKTVALYQEISQI